MDGYTFDSGAFDGVKQEWQALQAGLAQDRAAAEMLVGVLAPGHEPASGFVARDQNGSGQALVDSITQMQAFVDSYIAGLDQSRQQYQVQEDSTADTMRSGARS
jgi:PE family protein